MKWNIFAAGLVLLLSPVACHGAASDPDPFASFTRHWRDDPVWHDGQAEMAVYDATRTVYGKSRPYRATLYTNKELADPETKTKSAGDHGRAVFRTHLREDIDTENYTYHYSTMCYVGTKDLKSLKIDMGSQEDCGTTFKQFVNHAGNCQWSMFSYFPKEGFRNGSYRPKRNFAFQDALSLVLRGYPFDQPSLFKITLLPDQTTNKWSPNKPTPAVVQYAGRELLRLPIGEVEAHHLTVGLRPTNRARDVGSKDNQHDYWFAADGSLPWLHVMVQYEGPWGLTYRLREHRRWAYWK